MTSKKRSSKNAGQKDVRLITPNDGRESKILGVSVRGCLALILVLTVCCMAMKQIDVKEPLYSLVLLSVGFYFGQKRFEQNGNYRK